MKYVVGGGTSNQYDAMRLMNSVVGSCRPVRIPEGEADDLAKHVARRIETWLTGKTEVTDRDLRAQTGAALERLCPDAAYYHLNLGQII
jgi:hypothetical protein